MNVTPTNFTIAEYCSQMRAKDIVANREYQRSPKVWPAAARSYLIETILLGYPIPKLCLYQKTDLRTRKTVKEIVDGQQRSSAIFDYFNDELRLSGKSEYAGKKFSQLEEPDQQRFVSYPLSADVFANATAENIRQVFRRMNSYTVPLNGQEQRHAVYQGLFKWFVVDLTERFAQVLKDVGTFSETQLSRMADARLFTDICFTMLNGIHSMSEKQLNTLYKDKDETFPEKHELDQRLPRIVDQIATWQPIHNTGLTKPYNFYSLALAMEHVRSPLAPLNSVVNLTGGVQVDAELALQRLSAYADALEEPEAHPDLAPFVNACAKATNRIQPRRDRFIWLCRALAPEAFR